MLKQHKGWMAAAALVTLAACGNGENEGNSGGNGSASGNDDGGSGKLTLYTSGPGGMAEQLVEAFEEETGIEVDIFQGTTGDVLGRLEGEGANPIADVVALASMPPGHGV
ncbi:type 2 periplasmic-binding domain-containing protein [Salisediminibacterium selenitireducens]|uniref:hypothetical protein n=1 Tax=Salisediminibacterium selenitireducens TaxID=85683 RepID=UPI0002F97472|nr:hypothetical protein [Salisediminibacterium selenitireducens]